MKVKTLKFSSETVLSYVVLFAYLGYMRNNLQKRWQVDKIGVKNRDRYRTLLIRQYPRGLHDGARKC